MNVNASSPSCSAGTPENDAVSGSVGGPATVADTDCDSFRPSEAQMAPAALQSVVSGSVTSTAPRPSGSTVMFQFWLLPCVCRLAFVTLPPLTWNAESRSVV